MAIMVLDGMQSHRWAAPPTTSRSTRVTSAPSLAAVEAPEVPAGPAPTTTNRNATPLPRRREDAEGLAQHVAHLAEGGVGLEGVLHRVEEVLLRAGGLVEAVERLLHGGVVAAIAERSHAFGLL